MCLTWLWLLIFVNLLGAACGISNPDSDNLEVRVRDHREAIGDFSELWLTLSSVGIHPAGQTHNEGWIMLEPSVQTLDLTQYVDGQEVVIVQAAVETGFYNAVRLNVDRALGMLVDGQQVEVTIRSEIEALDFWVRDGQITTLTLDLVVLDLGDHPDRGYELHLREVTVK